MPNLELELIDMGSLVKLISTKLFRFSQIKVYLCKSK
jgi:hypothetical protein